MTVDELITELQKCPGDMPVHVWTREEEFSEVGVWVDEAEGSSGRGGVMVVKVRGE